MKRFLRSVSSVFLVLGVALALWPLGQIAYARWNQRALQQEWKQAASKNAASNASLVAHSAGSNARKTQATATTAMPRLKVKSAAAKGAARAQAKWPPTRILIPDIGLDAIVVQGTDAGALERGPGHTPASVLPGQPGNCAISAHRNVFGSWFLRVDELLPGSRITLKTPNETFVYEVLQSLSVPDSDTRVLRATPGQQATPQLTLITCTLPRTTSRIAVIATLVPPDEL